MRFYERNADCFLHIFFFEEEVKIKYKMNFPKIADMFELKQTLKSMF
jgi:hypothetical protein